MKGTDSGIYHVARQLSDMANIIYVILHIILVGGPRQIIRAARQSPARSWLIVALGYCLPSSRRASTTNAGSHLFKSDIVGFSSKSSGHFSRVYFDSSAFSKRRTHVTPTGYFARYFSAYKLSLTRSLQFARTARTEKAFRGNFLLPFTKR